MQIQNIDFELCIDVSIGVYKVKKHIRIILFYVFCEMVLELIHLKSDYTHFAVDQLILCTHLRRITRCTHLSFKYVRSHWPFYQLTTRLNAKYEQQCTLYVSAVPMLLLYTLLLCT